MAVPSYLSDMTNLLLDMASTTGWTALGGGGAALVAPETDAFAQGNNCISKGYFSDSIKGMIYDMGAGQSITSGKAVYMWLYLTPFNKADTEALGGIRVIIGSAITDYKHWYVRGGDTGGFGGFFTAVVDPAITADTTTGTPTATLQFFGALAKIVGSVSRGQIFYIDAFRWGRDYTITGGDVTNGYATFAGLAAHNDEATRRYGQFQSKEGSYTLQGRLLLGSSGTAVDFRDSNRSILVGNTKKVQSDFNGLEIINASSRVDWANIQIAALGTVSKGALTVTDNADVNIDFCTFTDMSTFSFLSNSTVNNTTFRRCGLITQGGAVFNGCLVDSGTATRSMAVDTIANITNTTFISDGTGYAIEGFSSAGDYTLTGITFTGYASGNGTTGNEAIHVLAASGIVNLTIEGGGNAPSIHTAGATVNVIAGEVVVAVTVKDIDGNNIESAMVIVVAATGGPMPYNVAITITRSDSTATVPHTAHGMVTGDKVLIKGAAEGEYNGVYAITKINNDSYSYAVSGTPATPATGTITATYVVLSGLTVSGYISMSRAFSYAQPVSGRARKSTGSSLFKTSTIVGTISSTGGFSTTILLIRDD